VPDRKSLKLMFPRVQLGVAAAIEAWTRAGGSVHADPRDERVASDEDAPLDHLREAVARGTIEPWERDRIDEVPAHRRGMVTACGLTVDEDWTFREAIDRCLRPDGTLDMARFGVEGQDLLNPLWLVKGLSNNVLAFASRYLDVTGWNDNLEAGPAGGLLALHMAAAAVADGTVDLALAGASDTLVTVEDMLGLARQDAFSPPGFAPAQGAGFALLVPAREPGVRVLGSAIGLGAGGTGAGPGLARGTRDRLAEVSDEARRRAGCVPAMTLVGPRLPPRGLDVFGPLGDCGAAAGGVLLAAAFAAWEVDDLQGAIELLAASPGGEVGAVVLGHG
jgi:hypothetical protein